MKKIFLLVLISLIINGLNINAQDTKDQVLISIDNTDITVSEFERIYKKNNSDSVVDQNSLNEYLDLFINFKLKVIEAEKLGLDTLKAFEIELGGYRKQLEKPYLTDNSIDEKLFTEAYERMQKDVKASHILLKMEENAVPSDTLKVYKRIIEIRDRIVKGEDFADVAREVSEDPSAKNNGGMLGYFTVFQMVYPFESAAYNTEINEISMPVRTKFGYHLLKTWDKRDAVGKVKVAHIMRATPRGSKPEIALKAKDSIYMIHEKLKNGGDFAELAKKYSDDKSSATMGGELRMFSTGKMVPEFEKAAFELTTVGEISQPIRTAYGWHVLKLIKKSKVGTYKEMESLIKSKVSKDARAEKSKKAVTERIKKEYNFKYNKKKLAQFYTAVDTSIYNGSWTADKAKHLNSDFVWFADKTLNQQWFANYISGKRNPVKSSSIEGYVNNMFDYFVEQRLTKYEKTQLERKYPDFRYLMQEYHDGILLFELTDKMVWTKAVEDSAGLQEFYEANKENYLWGERFDGRIYTCENAKVHKKLTKFLSKEENKKAAISEILAKYNKEDSKLVSIEEDIYSKGDNETVDALIWSIGSIDDYTKSKSILIGDKLDPTPKKLNEARGLITADYQSFLEEKWVNELREKSNITINKELLNSIK